MTKTTSYPSPDEAAISWLNRLLGFLAETCNVPSALIMRVSADEIEVLSSANTPATPYQVGDKEHLNCGLYCEHVMTHNAPLLVPDATVDPEWRDNPDIRLGMISYLGFPLTWPDGNIYGTICILDSKKNAYSPRIQGIVELFKNIVENYLALMFETQRAKDALESLQSNREELTQAILLAVEAKANNSKVIKKTSDDLSDTVDDLIHLLESPAWQKLVAQSANDEDLQSQLLQTISKVSALSRKLARSQTNSKD